MATHNHQDGPEPAENAALASLLEQAGFPEPSKQLMAKLMEIPKVLPRENRRGAFAGFWRPFSLGLGTLLVGLFFGHVTAPQQQANETRELEFEQVFSNLVLATTSIQTVSESE